MISGELYVRTAQLELLRKELTTLRQHRQGELAERLRIAREAASTDDSTELELARREVDTVEDRIDYLRGVLAVALPLDEMTAPTGTVALGSRITVLDLDTEEEWELTLVSSVEADPLLDLISVDCPVGQALLGRKPGDRVEVAAPDGPVRLEVREVDQQCGGREQA